MFHNAFKRIYVSANWSCVIFACQNHADAALSITWLLMAYLHNTYLHSPDAGLVQQWLNIRYRRPVRPSASPIASISCTTIWIQLCIWRFSSFWLRPGFCMKKNQKNFIMVRVSMPRKEVSILWESFVSYTCGVIDSAGGCAGTLQLLKDGEYAIECNSPEEAERLQSRDPASWRWQMNGSI